MTNPIQAIIEKMAELDKEIEALGTDAIKEQAQKVFDAMPGIHAIAWTQFAPAFNDGDPCIFSAGDMHYAFKPVVMDEDNVMYFADDIDQEQELDMEEHLNCTWSRSYELLPDATHEERKVLQQHLDDKVAPMGAIPDDILCKIFGDSQKVIILRDGTVINEEYDCGS